MIRSPNKGIIYIVALLAMLFWGMSFVWTTVVLKYYDPISTIFLRLVLSTIILFSGLALFKKLEKINKEDYKLFLISALFNPFFYFLGENFGLKYSTPTIASVLIATIPLFVPVAAYFMLKERVSRMSIIGILISFLGIIVMLVNRDLSLNTSPLGAGLLGIAVASAVFYTILIKKLSPKYSAFTIIAVQNLIGIIYFLPLFLIFGLNKFVQVKPNFELISSLFALAFFCSTLAFVFFTISIKNIGVSRTSVFGNLIPVFTAIFSFIILTEQFNLNKIVGMGIVMVGVIIAQMHRKRRY